MADYLSFPDSIDWQLGQDFCIDMQVYPTTLPTTGQTQTFMAQYVDANNYWAFNIANVSGTLKLQFKCVSSSSTIIDVTKTATLTVNTWQHVEVDRVGGIFKFFLNGNQCGADEVDTSNIPDFAGSLYISSLDGTNQLFVGYLDEYRLQDTYVHTSGFTPPIKAYSRDTIEFGLQVLEYQSTQSAAAGTDTTNIAITGHGLDTNDMIINTTRRTTDIGRGSRPVYTTGTTTNNIALKLAITGQTTGDSIRLYRFTDRTNKVLIKTLRVSRRLSGLSELSFSIKTDKDYLLRAGQYVRLAYMQDSTTYYYFTGNIQSAKRRLIAEDNTVIFQDIQCVGLSQIPARRTIQLNYASGTTCGEIVEDMADEYLLAEGIRKSTINAGATLDEDWQVDVVTVSEVLDQCASKSGYQWFVNDSGLLNFYQDPASILEEEAITDAGTFKDYKNLDFTESLNNYTNKVFVEGGFDERGNPIIISASDLTEINAMQELCAGTGVYGFVQRDSNITESNYVTAGAGTTTTNINYTAHGQVVGDMIWNVTRNIYTTVIVLVNADNVTVETVAGQTSGDIIAFFDQANDIISNYFKKQGFLPIEFTFTTRYLEYAPGNKLNVNLADYGISSTYYLVESVDISDTGGVTGSFIATVKCNLRKTANFSTQRTGNYLDYFGGF